MDNDFSYRLFFKLNKSPCCVIRAGTYEIIEVNDAFSESIINNDLALKLNFVDDLVKASDKNNFVQLLNSIAANHNSSDDVTLDTLTENISGNILIRYTVTVTIILYLNNFNSKFSNIQSL
jgi:hypothetical protein